MAPKTRRGGARAAAAPTKTAKATKTATAAKPPARPPTKPTATPAASAPTSSAHDTALADAANAAASAVATTASVSTAEPLADDDAPRKKRRTLRDAEQELESSRAALQEAKKKLIVTARENAKMKVLLMRYIDKDDSLLCTSQLSMASQSQSQQEAPPAAPLLPPQRTGGFSTHSFDSDSTQSTAVDSSDATMLDESENSETSLWTSSEFQSSEDNAAENTEPDADTDALLMLGPVSQLSQMSQWSEFSSTSNLDEIITFLEKQDTVENDRVVTLESEVKELQAQKTHVRVGVGVIVTSPLHPTCVLIGQRRGSHGAGKFALPGGHLEMYESWEECAIREVKEETDLDVVNVKFAYVTNDPMADEGKHYITIFVHARVDGAQTPRNMEPDKCAGWHWEPWPQLCLRDNMFLPLYHLTRSAFTPAFDVE